jgi:hypothetical protein
MSERLPFPPLNLTPEERLLLACAVPPERWDRDRITQFGSSVEDWAAFGEKALRTKFAPLVYTRLCDSGIDLPRPLLMRLGAAYIAAEGANRRLLAERDRVLAAFKDAKLSALPLKGCALAEPLYGDPALRPMGDLDLLLREEEMNKAVRLLTTLGYRTDGIDPRGETFFYREEDHLYIDAHTDLDPSGRFRISSSELWEQSAPLPQEEGTDFVTLSVQHHFVHALLHAARHRLDSLGPLVDAAWLAARWPNDLRWDTLPSLAKRWRCREALGFALVVANRLFEMPVPKETFRALAPRGWRKRALSLLWPGDSPLQPLESLPRTHRLLFSALTTSWPGGFLGATRRFGRIRPVHEDITTEHTEEHGEPLNCNTKNTKPTKSTKENENS